MVDDMTPKRELDPEDPDFEDDGSRPIIVSLNPPMERITWQRLLVIAVLLGGAVGVGYLIYRFITLEGGNGPSRGLEGVVLLVAGFVTVALLLYLGTVVLRALDMGAPGEALGMPEGSIRALIAMSLILIFAIIGILVFNAGGAGGAVVSSGLTQAQIDALRADGALLISQTLQTPVPAAPEAALYTITSRPAMTQESHDFGLQLMTTVSTLVVAVAGFYFGSRAVTQATTTVTEQLRLARSYSRRGIVGARPEPDAETEEAPGEVVENELGEAEETDEEVEQEAVDTEAVGEGAGKASTESEASQDGDDVAGAEGDDADDAGLDLDAGETEPAADITDEDGEPPAQQPQQPPA